VEDRTQSLLHTVEGPKGIAQVYEVESTAPGQATVIRYEVVCGQQRERVQALGHACILAEELAGAQP